jgi:erythromycin esterase-like protein
MNSLLFALLSLPVIVNAPRGATSASGMVEEHAAALAFAEFLSHYFEAVLAEQFDAYVWFEETHAVTPLPAGRPHGAPETYPFGL